MKTSEIVKKYQVPSRTRKGVKYTVSKDKKGDFSCSCPRWIQTSPRKDCAHIKFVKTGQMEDTAMAKKRKLARKNGEPITAAKTTRGTLIRLLQKHVGKMVALKAIHAEVKRVKGWDDDDRVTRKVKAAVKSVKGWAESHDFKFVNSGSGMKFQKAA